MMCSDTDSTAIPSAAAPLSTTKEQVLPVGNKEEQTVPVLFCGTDAPPQPVVVVHAPRCGCGCAPNILSLFEMAALRKQAKLKKEQEASKTRGAR
jgi:hypothetical protein